MKAQTNKPRLYLLSFVVFFSSFTSEGISQTNSFPQKTIIIDNKASKVSLEAMQLECFDRVKNTAFTTNQNATKGKPFVNSLGMKFVPVVTASNGRKVYFSIWETRVKDFRAFVEATGHDMTGKTYSLDSKEYRQRGGSWKLPKFPIAEDHCVTCVSWNDAKAFAKWLTQKERKKGLIGPNQGYRLPTDVEWSYAVGIGEEQGNTPDERYGNEKGGYPWGDYWPPKKGDEGNYAGEESYWGGAKRVKKWLRVSGYRDRHPRTAPVGSYRMNRYGLYDMGGNVFELCEDIYDTLEKYRVIRGASWGQAKDLSSSCRNLVSTTERDDQIGFRVVLEIK